MLRIYKGPRDDLQVVGRTDDSGQTFSTDEKWVGRVDAQGRVFTGRSTDEKWVGRVDAQGRVFTGRSTDEKWVGRVDAQGRVFTGRSTDEKFVGCVNGVTASDLTQPAGACLLLGLLEPDRSEREQTETPLAHAGPSAALETLGGAALKAVVSNVRRTSLSPRLVGGDPESFIRRLGDLDWDQRLDAFRKVAQETSGSDGSGLLAYVLREAHRGVPGEPTFLLPLAAAAIKTAPFFERAETLSALTGLLLDNSWGTRLLAGLAIGELGDAAATSALEQLLIHDPDWDVRSAAAQAAARLGTASATTTLGRYQNDLAARDQALSREWAQLDANLDAAERTSPPPAPRPVPELIEQSFARITKVTGKNSVVEDADAGLRFQWKESWIPRGADMRRIEQRYVKLYWMIVRGEWEP